MSQTLYYLRRAEAKSGPFTLGQLRSMWQLGAVTADADYRFDPAAEWQPLTNLRKLLEQPIAVSTAKTAAPAASGGEGLVLPIVALVLSLLPVFCFGGLICAHIAFARRRSANDSAPRVITIISLVLGYLMAIQSLFLLVAMARVSIEKRRMDREFQREIGIQYRR